jgi:proline iminopeptidase
VRVLAGDLQLFFDIEGTQLRPERTSVAEVPTVVVLHDGPGGDHTTFKHPAFGPRLAEAAQVVYLDLRGHGRSERSEPDCWTLDVWADDVRAFCDALGLDAPIVFGSGFGALVAVRYAARHPGHAGRLVLARPVARLDAAASVATFDRLAGAEAAASAQAFYDTPTVDTYTQFMLTMMRLFRGATVDEVQDSLFRSQWNVELALQWYAQEAFAFDLRDDAARIDVPTLVLAGDDDPLMPADGAAALVDAMDDSLVRFHRFPGVRHAIYADEPRAMAETLAFVAEARPEPTPLFG